MKSKLLFVIALVLLSGCDENWQSHIDPGPFIAPDGKYPRSHCVPVYAPTDKKQTSLFSHLWDKLNGTKD
jgi:hypothetical protein